MQIARNSYSEVLQFRVPPELQSAIARLAARECLSVSAVIRRTLAEAIRREGVPLSHQDTPGDRRAYEEVR